jgi:hypothetical protein
MTKRISAWLLTLLIALPALADEGMWLPMWLKIKEIEKMKERGLQIPFDEIYSHSKPSLKDAVVSLDNGGCTGEFVSANGLLLTNHHCGFDNIQAHSSVENDYIKNGFWAKSFADELPNPGKTATLLMRAHDISHLFEPLLKLVEGEQARMRAVDSLTAVFEMDAADSTNLEAKVVSFFNDSRFVLFLTKTYRDVRLVGTPPNHIGNFGGEYDNWMWPRHTGDFCLFRVYTGPDGEPADFSPQNVPFKPAKFLSISLDGYNEGDYSMVLGYPGSTDRYTTAANIRSLRYSQNPIVNEVRTIKQNIIKAQMQASPSIAIKYAAKYDQSANYQKYALGQNQGIDKLMLVDERSAKESKLRCLLEQMGDTTTIALMARNDLITNQFDNVVLTTKLFEETMLQGPELIYFSFQYLNKLFELRQTSPNDSAYQQRKDELLAFIDKHFKDYSSGLDKMVYTAMLGYVKDKQAESPLAMAFVPTKYEKWEANRYADFLYGKTIFTNQQMLVHMVTGKIPRSISKDPVLVLLQHTLQQFSEVSMVVDAMDEIQNQSARMLFAAYQKLYPDSSFYPDANSTMRISYGNVKSYVPRDGVRYGHFTTTDGILAKVNPMVKEFDVPEQTQLLYATQMQNRFAQNGQLHTCFITTNDITGGNSGSPVLDAKGRLLGLAFDGNWEGMTSDIAYSYGQQRTICVDIRYVLWTIEYVGQASHLINEMEIR